jgi:hypothetical protein
MEPIRATTAPFVPVTLTPWEYANAAAVAADRIARNQNNEGGLRAQAEHPLIFQTAAVCSEIAVAKALNQYPTAVGAWDAGRHAEFSKLPDVGHTIDAKRVRFPDSTHFSFSRKDIDLNRTLAVTYVEPELWHVRVLGWITASEALEKGWTATGDDYARGPIWALKLSGAIDELDVVTPDQKTGAEIRAEEEAAR